MNRWKNSLNGFTIVELLIVIVVLAILASVTVVAFTGIQQRAYNTQTITAVDQWAKGLISYATIHGDYPFTGDRNQTSPYPSDQASITHNYPCLGNYPDNKCASINGVNVLGAGNAYVNNELHDLVRSQFGSSLPQPSARDIVINGQPHRGAYINLVGYATGLNAPGVGPSIRFILAGSTTECATLGVGTMLSKIQGDNGVSCAVMLPDFR